MECRYRNRWYDTTHHDQVRRRRMVPTEPSDDIQLPQRHERPEPDAAVQASWAVDQHAVQDPGVVCRSSGNGAVDVARPEKRFSAPAMDRKQATFEAQACKRGRRDDVSCVAGGGG